MKEKPSEILFKGLLVRNKAANLLLRLINFFFKREKSDLEFTSFKKILVCNNAHLGDVILSTSVIPLLKKNYPQASIHFLCGSWSKEILINHPLIEKVFFYDHWKLNRSAKSIFLKVYQQVRTFRSTLKDVRKERYDLAIDFYFHYPNSIFLLWKSNVPIRLGYTSGGFGNLLTHGMEWVYRKQSVLKYHVDLVKLILSVSPDEEKSLRPVLSSFSPELTAKIYKIFQNNKINFNKYVVLHIGAGKVMREWPIDNWSGLVKELIGSGCELVFTGYGNHEEMLIRQIISDVPECLNLCSKLSLLESAYVIKNAQTLICVDSVAGHIASAFDTHAIVIGNGLNSTLLWKPVSDKTDYLVHQVPCMPCHTGCEGMECVRSIKVGEVIKFVA